MQIQNCRGAVINRNIERWFDTDSHESPQREEISDVLLLVRGSAMSPGADVAVQHTGISEYPKKAANARRYEDEGDSRQCNVCVASEVILSRQFEHLQCQLRDESNTQRRSEKTTDGDDITAIPVYPRPCIF